MEDKGGGGGSPTVLSLPRSVVTVKRLLPVVVHSLRNQIDRARIVTVSEKHGGHVPEFFASCQKRPHEPLYSVLFAELVPHAVIAIGAGLI